MSAKMQQGNFEACDERTEGDNFHTSIYEADYKGLLIARCNQNGKYPHQVQAILNGLNGKRQSLDEITTLRAELEEAATKADRIAEIIKRNLYHQHEKVEDARMFALQLAGDLRSLKGGKS